MGTLYLVRHGQASFGAANYDQLSPLGVQQCRQLGSYFASKRRRFAAVYTGTLQRQIQSYAALASGLGAQQPSQQLPGLNEYDSHAVIAAVHPQPLP
jgi:broad specificity phosphatase PhoE